MKITGTYQFTDRAAHDELVVTLAEMKTHLRIEQSFTEDDDYIEALILAAQTEVESITWRYLNENTVSFSDGAWPEDNIIYLVRGPVWKVESFTYKNTDGDDVAMSTGVDYNFDIYNEIGRVNLITRPTLNTEVLNPITITYKTRFNVNDDSNIIPQSIKTAIKLMGAHWYENRQDVQVGQSVADVPKTSEWILNPYKIRVF
jgi:uncharacterized phiE125 gp8 family phage protein